MRCRPETDNAAPLNTTPIASSGHPSHFKFSSVVITHHRDARGLAGAVHRTVRVQETLVLSTATGHLLLFSGVRARTLKRRFAPKQRTCACRPCPALRRCCHPQSTEFEALMLVLMFVNSASHVHGIC
jgi:hypothetical protein